MGKQYQYNHGVNYGKCDESRVILETEMDIMEATFILIIRKEMKKKCELDDVF